MVKGQRQVLACLLFLFAFLGFFPISFAHAQAKFTGQVSVGLTAVTIGVNTNRFDLLVKNLSTSANPVFCGPVGVTASGATGGLELAPNQGVAVTTFSDQVYQCISGAGTNTVSFQENRR